MKVAVGTIFSINGENYRIDDVNAERVIARMLDEEHTAVLDRADLEASFAVLNADRAQAQRELDEAEADHYRRLGI